MKAWIGLGSNLGARRDHLEKAAHLLKILAKPGSFRVSSIYETSALVPEGAPADWNRPFLNAVIELEFNGEAVDLFKHLQRIETQVGRQPANERWAPRVLDLDLLLFGDLILETPELRIPHPRMHERAFVLDPLKDLQPGLTIPGLGSETILQRARKLPGHAPLWMGILNLTPDSFSDGGELSDFFSLKRKLDEWDLAGVQVFDLGAESTRPGAGLVPPVSEWDRLQPALEMIQLRFRGRMFRPLVSVDTRHPEIVEKVLQMGIDWINDVSGFVDSRMIDAVKSKRGTVVAMHSLTVPADPSVILPPDQDPVKAVKTWAWRKLEDLDKRGISMDRVVLDPGIGFGKSAQQSLAILKRWDELAEIPVRWACGHSRKSFFQIWSTRPARERDWESVGVSLNLARKGVDILRVHEPVSHLRAHQSFQETSR